MENTKAQFEITRFEAFALYKHYREMAKDCKEKGRWSLEDEYNIRSNKWLDIAVEIEKSNSDGVNEFLEVN